MTTTTNDIFPKFCLFQLEELHARLKSRKATLKEREEKLKHFEAQIAEREGKWWKILVKNFKLILAMNFMGSLFSLS